VTFVVSGRVPGVDRFYDAMRGTTAVPTKTSPAYASCGAIRGTRRASASGILIRDADILGSGSQAGEAVQSLEAEQSGREELRNRGWCGVAWIAAHP